MASPIPSPFPGECPSGLGPKGVANATIVAVFAAIYVIVVAVRLYVRRFILHALWWIDYTIVLAVLFLLPYNGLAWYSTYLGMGQDLPCVNPLHVPKILLYKFINQVLVIFSNMFSRISVALFLIRLFAISNRVKTWLYLFTGFVILVWLACAIAVFPQCHPRERLWSPLMPGECWFKRASLVPGYLSGAVAMLSDSVLVCLPILFMWNIQMKMRLKIGIWALMGPGVFTGTGTCALTRTIMLHRAYDLNVTHDLVDLGIFATLKAAVAIIAATIPTLRPLVTRPKTPSGTSGLSNQKLRPGYKKMSSSKDLSNHQGQASRPWTHGNQPSQDANLDTPCRTTVRASGGTSGNASETDMIPLMDVGRIGKRVDVSVV